MKYKSQSKNFRSNQKKRLAAYQKARKQGFSGGSALRAARETNKSVSAQRKRLQGFNRKTGRVQQGLDRTRSYQVSTPGRVDQHYTTTSQGGVLNEKGRALTEVERNRLGRTAGWKAQTTYSPTGNRLRTNMVPDFGNAQISNNPNQQGGHVNYGIGRQGAEAAYNATGGRFGQASQQRQFDNGQLRFGADAAKAAQNLFGTGSVTNPLGNDLSLYMGTNPTSTQTTPYGAKNPLSVDLTPPTPVDSKSYNISAQGWQNVVPSAGQGQNVDSTRYQMELEQRQLAEKQAQEYYDTLKKQQENETNSAMSQWEQSNNPKYADLLSQADKNVQSGIEQLMRFKGAKGTARSSRTMSAMQELQQKGNAIKDRILDEKARERQLYQMQLAGASGPALQSAAQALQEAKTKRMGAEAVLQTAQQGLLLEQQQLAEQKRLAEQQQYVDYLKQVGLAVDPTTGETVKSLQGMLDEAKAMKDTASAQKYLMESKKLQKALDNDYQVEFKKDPAGNQLAIWYDPAKPGEMQSVVVPNQQAAPSGGGGGYGGGGGNGSKYNKSTIADSTLIDKLTNSPYSMAEVGDILNGLPGTQAYKGKAYEQIWKNRVNKQNEFIKKIGASSPLAAGALNVLNNVGFDPYKTNLNIDWKQTNA